MSEQSSQSHRPLTSAAEKLRQDLDRWLEAAWSQGERALDAFGIREAGRWAPHVDVIESTEDVTVLVDLPDIPAESVDVSLAGNMLTISGRSVDAELKPDEKYQVRERRHGEFTRSIPLPAAVNEEQVSAETHNGTLRIVLGKTEKAKPKHIPVNAGRPMANAEMM